MLEISSGLFDIRRSHGDGRCMSEHSVVDAQSHLSELIGRALAGDDVVIGMEAAAKA